VTGADNQQERPGFEQWIVGFVDGEGLLQRSDLPRTEPRGSAGRCSLSSAWFKERRGSAYCASCSSTLGVDESAAIEGETTIGRMFSDGQCDRSTSTLQSSIPFFERFPLRTAKAEEFKRFAGIVRMMLRGEHLTPAGLRAIASIAQGMNFRRPSRYLESSEAIRQPAPTTRS
jgi:hypothetical protein